MGTIKDKVAIITGASSGIGKAIAVLFAKEGAKVVVSDIDEKKGKEVVKEINDKGGESFFVKADSSSAEDNKKLVEKTVEKYGALHIAVNNAGIGGPQANVGDYPIDGWEKVIAINLNGVFYGMRYQIPAMEKSNGGSIINMASILGSVGFPTSAAYVAAKHGVVGLSKNAALEYATKNIRINSVGPGFIKTPLVEENLDADTLKFLETKHAMNRLGEPNEVAELCLWLASDKSSFVTGSYYTVDGGYTAQ
ncbi:MAG: short-chain dehydrogenase [Flavobacteriales bacterium]|nr:short-chain dehydrogenase [Flavobacteriales bacterium]|tara:strand:- start:86827 stop:87579 length:753 start_codon:yes stop_codon:yes gene_type:complete